MGMGVEKHMMGAENGYWDFIGYTNNVFSMENCRALYKYVCVSFPIILTIDTFAVQCEQMSN